MRLGSLKKITSTKPDLILSNNTVIPYWKMEQHAIKSIDGNGLVDRLANLEGFDIDFDDLQTIIRWFWAWQKGQIE